MNRFFKSSFKFLAAFSIVEAIGRHPVTAGSLMLLGAGGVVGAAALITPTPVPQPSAFFTPSNASTTANNVLKANGGSSGAFTVPSTSTNSWFVFVKGQVDASLGTSPSQVEYALGAIGVAGLLQVSPTVSTTPIFSGQLTAGGPENWWTALSYNPSTALSVTTTNAGYNSGVYPWTASIGCERSPSGWLVINGANGKPAVAGMRDPGFGCPGVSAAPTFNLGTIAGTGTAQAATGTTWISAYNSTFGLVKFTFALSPGVALGTQFTIAGATPGGYNGTYTAINGPGCTTSGTTLCGILSGLSTSPGAISIEGNFFNGASTSNGSAASVITLQNLNGGTFGGYGISATQPAQNFCAVIGQYGSDSTSLASGAVAGRPFAAMSDNNGAALPGSPALGYVNLNNNTALPNGVQLSNVSFSGHIMTATVTAGTLYPGMWIGEGGVTTAGTLEQFGTGGTTGTASNQATSQTYQVTGTLTIAGPIAANAWNPFFTSTLPTGANAPVAKTSAAIGDVVNTLIGGKNATLNTAETSWGGSLADASMIYGAFPVSTGAGGDSPAGTPSQLALKSLCTGSGGDVHSWVATNITVGGTTGVHALYRLNDPGSWGDSSVATANATINGTALTINSTTDGSTSSLASGDVVSGPGITGCPSTCPTISSGSGSSYTLNASGSSSALTESVAIGLFKPATPIAVATISSGFITAGSPAKLTATTVTAGNILPGQIVFNSSLACPAQVANSVVGNTTGVYNLAPAAPTCAIPSVGSSGSPQPFTTSSVQGGPVISALPALTMSDPGPSATFPVLNYSAATGSIEVSGTYDTGTLGGTPSAIQAQVSNIPGGPSIPGFTWANLSSGSVSGGTWSGTIAGVPAGGPYYVSVRAANGQAYTFSTSPWYVGIIVGFFGEGQMEQMFFAGGTGNATTTLSGQGFSTVFGGNGGGGFGSSAFSSSAPPIPTTGFSTSLVAPHPLDDFQFNGTASNPLGDGIVGFVQAMATETGWPVSVINMARNSSAAENYAAGYVPQVQQVGTTDGTSTIWCSAATYCTNDSGGELTFNGGQLLSTYPAIQVDTFAVTNNTSAQTWNTILPGSFKLIEGGSIVNGVVSGGTIVCSDPAVGTAWGVSSGICSGAGISASFVNYQSGDFSVTFTSAPSSGQPLFAQWTNVSDPGVFGNPGCTQGVTNACNGAFTGTDITGNGTPASGIISQQLSHAPGGLSAVVRNQCEAGDSAYNSSFMPQAQSYAALWGFEFGSALPSRAPGYSATTPVFQGGMVRFVQVVGALGLMQPFGCDEVMRDMGSPSSFTGSLSTGGVLTLGSGVTGTLWEGEPLAYSGSSAVITATVSGTSLTMTGITSGAAPASGAWNGYQVQAPGITGCGQTCPTIVSGGNGTSSATFTLSGSGGTISSPIQVYVVLTPQIKGIASGTWGASGSTYNVSPAPPVAVSSTAIDNPLYYGSPGSGYGAGASTYGGAMNDMAMLAGAPPGGLTGDMVHPTSGLYGGERIGRRWAAIMWGALNPSANVAQPTLARAKDAACAAGAVASPCFDGTSTFSGVTGFNCSTAANAPYGCILFDFSVNTGGTFGTPKALNTCGANLSGTTAGNVTVTPAVGSCTDGGVGQIVKGFRIGSAQRTMWDAGSVYFDGLDPANGQFIPASAFTCEQVAATKVECWNSQSAWSTGATFASFGDNGYAAGRMGSIVGPDGGGSLGFTAGSGYTNGTYTSTATSGTATCSSVFPSVTVTVAGGSITSVLPKTAGAGCSTTVGFAVPAGAGAGSGGAISTLALGPVGLDWSAGGVATYQTDQNLMGGFLYDNSGVTGNPLNAVFTNGSGGVLEPGIAVEPFGLDLGVAVSG